MKIQLKRSGYALPATIMVSVLLVAMGLVVSIFASMQVWADPQGGDSNDSDVGGCSAAGTNCTSWGVTWVKQPLNEFLQSAERVGLSSSQKQDMINACAGMAEPYVMRLAYVDFANGGTIQLNSVSGLISNERADRNNAIYVDPATIPNGMSAAEAQILFNYALSIGVNMEYAWDQMAIFAYDIAWDSCGTDAACIAELIDKRKEEAEERGDGSNAMPFFQSKTIIDVGDGIPEGPQDSGWDGHVAIEFSTDEPSVVVNFSHVMNYQPNGFKMGADDAFTTEDTAGGIDNPPAIADVADTVNNHTNFSITTGGGGDFGVYTTSGGSQTYPTAAQTVSLAPGETKTVCSYISYEHKFANMRSKKHITQKAVAATATLPAVDEISHFDWYTGYSGSGSSGACATITRPLDPTGSPKNPDASGTTTSNVMFAGETTRLGWDIQARGYEVRRLKERQITAHMINVIPNYDGLFFNGVARSPSSPYDYFSSSLNSNIVNHHNFGEEARDIDDNMDTYSNAFAVVVPDYVGYKYCHTGGYRFESWYSINGNWSHDTRSGKNYWYIYDASCRTVAKKPTVAIWNSSLFTAGGIITTTASRYDDAQFGKRDTEGGPMTLYGAWSEYLAVVKGNVEYFGSGSSFATGSRTMLSPKSYNPLETSNSSLTISNDEQLGGSEINSNSTYRTRLSTFLENRATLLQSSELGAMENVSTTQILRRDGNLKITGNIKLADSNYDSIYHLPQVVIFVHGNVEIASNVTQIDAWLIVDGNVNTCSEFTSGVTMSDADRRNGDYCTNQLAFNGPVMANKIILNRSFGSDPIVTRTGTFGAPPAKYNAGEIFNLRADVYLWARAQAGRYDSSYTKSYSRELSPRY